MGVVAQWSGWDCVRCGVEGGCVCVLMVCKEFMLQSGDAVSGSGGKHMVAMVAIMVAVARSIGGGGGGVANTDHTGVDGGKAWCGWRRAWALALVVGRDAQMVEAVSIGGVGDGCGGWHWRHCVVAVVVGWFSWWRLGGGQGFVGSAVCGRSGGGGGADCCV